MDQSNALNYWRRGAFAVGVLLFALPMMDVTLRGSQYQRLSGFNLISTQWFDRSLQLLAVLACVACFGALIASLLADAPALLLSVGAGGFSIFMLITLAIQFNKVLERYSSSFGLSYLLPFYLAVLAIGGGAILSGIRWSRLYPGVLRSLFTDEPLPMQTMASGIVGNAPYLTPADWDRVGGVGLAPRPVAWEQTHSGVLDSLGTIVDSWADLVDDHGDKATAIIAAFQERLTARQLPGIMRAMQSFRTSFLSRNVRAYQIIRTHIGATVTVHIGKFGRDLYLSWDLWIRPVPAWNVIFIILALGAFFGLCAGIPAGGANRLLPAIVPVLLWGVTSLIVAFWLFVLVGIAGRIVKGSFLAFFIRRLTHFDVDDITAIQFAVHHSLLESVDRVGLDAKVLRTKTAFHGGQRERLI